MELSQMQHIEKLNWRKNLLSPEIRIREEYESQRHREQGQCAATSTELEDLLSDYPQQVLINICWMNGMNKHQDANVLLSVSSSYKPESSCLLKRHSFFLTFYYFFSTVQHSDPVTHTCIQSFFSHYMFHHKWLDRVPSATQQEPIGKQTLPNASAGHFLTTTDWTKRKRSKNTANSLMYSTVIEIPSNGIIYTR